MMTTTYIFRHHNIMLPNPGGQIGASEVIGRDDIIGYIWDVLRRQSVLLTAERRMGKTTIIRKMEKEHRFGMILVYRDLERAYSPIEFVEIVVRDVEDYLSRRSKIGNGIRKLLSRLGGIELEAVGCTMKLPEHLASHWKDFLTATIEDLMEHQDDTLVFLWDELPMMLENIANLHGENVAREILDLLRAMRNTYPRLRMVFTGSIGLHHVISAMKEKGYGNSPLNDMYFIDIEPLSAEDGATLARALLKGTKQFAADIDEIAAGIARAMDHVPFFIHHLVEKLRTLRSPLSPTTVEIAVDALLSDTNEPLDLDHYRARIRHYYHGEQFDIAMYVLDRLAIASEPLSIESLYNHVKAQLALTDRNRIVAIVDLLRRDHYLHREANGTLRFRLPLIQRYWRITRGLES